MKEIQELTEEIKQMKGYDGVFHQNIVDEHFQFHLVNKQHNPEALHKKTSDSFEPLNYANLNLLRFCKQMVEEYGAHTEEGAQWMSLMEPWEASFHQGGPFNSFQNAFQIIVGLEETGFPIFEKILGDEPMKKAFVDIPNEVKTFTQIKFCLPHDRLEAYMEHVIREATQEQELFFHLRDLSINHSFLLTGAQGDSRVEKALIKLRLLPFEECHQTHSIIESFTRLFGEGYALPGINEDILSLFSHEYKPGIFVTQGATNYKKFLFLLQIIDQVYQEDPNYAYAS
ncbi:MAG: hypothetical protein AAFQ98_15845 [Bacteroidota bacterium]